VASERNHNLEKGHKIECITLFNLDRIEISFALLMSCSVSLNTNLYYNDACMSLFNDTFIYAVTVNVFIDQFSFTSDQFKHHKLMAKIRR
jgi:hypothetical protein